MTHMSQRLNLGYKAASVFQICKGFKPKLFELHYTFYDF